LQRSSGSLNPSLKYFVECNYEPPFPKFSRSSVHGRLCTLFKVKDKKHHVALSELAGGKLANIVIDSPEIGK